MHNRSSIAARLPSSAAASVASASDSARKSVLFHGCCLCGWATTLDASHTSLCYCIVRLFPVRFCGCLRLAMSYTIQTPTVFTVTHLAQTKYTTATEQQSPLQDWPYGLLVAIRKHAGLTGPSMKSTRPGLKNHGRVAAWLIEFPLVLGILVLHSAAVSGTVLFFDCWHAGRGPQLIQGPWCPPAVAFCSSAFLVSGWVDTLCWCQSLMLLQSSGRPNLSAPMS